MWLWGGLSSFERGIQTLLFVIFPKNWVHRDHVSIINLWRSYQGSSSQRLLSSIEEIKCHCDIKGKARQVWAVVYHLLCMSCWLLIHRRLCHCNLVLMKVILLIFLMMLRLRSLQQLCGELFMVLKPLPKLSNTKPPMWRRPGTLVSSSTFLTTAVLLQILHALDPYFNQGWATLPLERTSCWLRSTLSLCSFVGKNDWFHGSLEIKYSALAHCRCRVIPFCLDKVSRFETSSPLLVL